MNDTLTRLSRDTEAANARSEFQQVLYCTGEAFPDEPIMFGRAYEHPPFFTYSSVAKNNEVTVEETNCSEAEFSGSLTRRLISATIGVKEWVRDQQGMYVGAFMWYKTNDTEVDRAGGFGWLTWTYKENNTRAEVPECGRTGDHLMLFLSNSSAGPALPSQITAEGAWSLLGSLGISQGGSDDTQATWAYIRAWNDEPEFYTVDATFDYALMGLIRGTSGIVDEKLNIHTRTLGNTTVTDFDMLDTDPFDKTDMVAGVDKDVMIVVTTSVFSVAAMTMNDAAFMGMKKLTGPHNGGFGLGEFYVGTAVRELEHQRDWDLPSTTVSFGPFNAVSTWKIRVR